MSTMAKLQEHFFVAANEQLPILRILCRLLGHYKERYGPQSAVASCNPSVISSRTSLDFLLVIHLSLQRCSLDYRDHPGGLLARKWDVQYQLMTYHVTAMPSRNTSSYEVYDSCSCAIKKTFQTVSKCPTAYPFKLSTISS